jgi:hypothetical protein
MYREAAWRWRRKILLRAVPLVIAVAAAEIAIAVITDRTPFWYFAVFALGFIAAGPVFLWSAEPKHVQSWWMGAEGERATDAELKKLGPGWTWFNGMELGRGDVDHVVSGPTGVYVLETKFLNGRIEVVDGRLLRWHDELPDRPDDWSGAADAAVRNAVRVHHWWAQSRGRKVWVRPVLVLWGEFAQGLVETDRITYVHGSRLVELLARAGR